MHPTGRDMQHFAGREGLSCSAGYEFAGAGDDDIYLVARVRILAVASQGLVNTDCY